MAVPWQPLRLLEGAAKRDVRALTLRRDCVRTGTGGALRSMPRQDLHDARGEKGRPADGSSVDSTVFGAAASVGAERSVAAEQHAECMPSASPDLAGGGLRAWIAF
ncbi:unnamed protein product [Gadus morhua 'NCC']